MVDDDPSLLETTAALLEDDFEVVVCQRSVEAPELLREDSFDVICTDYKMPVLDGVELLNRAAAMGLSIGAVLITGKAEAYYEEQLKNGTGAQRMPVSVIIKPYNARDLIEAITRAATFARMRRALAAANESTGRMRQGRP